MSRKQCISCSKVLLKSWQQKYCSNQCQADARYSVFKKQWLSGEKKIITKNISRHIKRFLIEKHGEKCIQCKWSKKHSVTGRVPLEVEHVDGNADNNELSNLKLLCPNCHSLTSSFRNLNKGNGRSRRRIAKNQYIMFK